jgi:hypothetical protein
MNEHVHPIFRNIINAFHDSSTPDKEAPEFAIRSNRNTLAVFQALNIPLYARFLPPSSLPLRTGSGQDEVLAGSSVMNTGHPTGDWLEHHLHVRPSPNCHLCPKSMLALFDTIRAPKLSDEELARDHADLDRSMDIPDDRDDAFEDTECLE